MRRWVKSLAKDIGDPLFFPLSRLKLQRRLQDVRTMGDLVELTFHFQGYGWYRSIGPYQVREEISQLGERIAQASPKTMLEIGTAAGGTLLLWCRVVQDCVISIDFPATRQLGGYPAARTKFYQSFTHGRTTRLHLLYRDSHQESTLQAVQELLKGRPLDCLFIDGDHTRMGCQRDFDLYGKLVAPEGLIIFHDILEHSAGPQASEVNSVWAGIKRRYRCEEIIRDPQQGWGGIGVVHL